MMTSEQDPVELLVDEFAARCRRGESPTVAEYAAKHPRYAGRIAELLPAVTLMEQLRSVAKSSLETAIRRKRPTDLPKLSADFEVLREIGRGGMGIVYEAEQKSLARRVAVKVLPKHVLLLDKHLERFRRETQTAAKLRHTNIVPVFGAGEQDGLHYYVMPLVRGVGLDEVIRELRSSPTARTADSPALAADIQSIARALVSRKFPATLAGRSGSSAGMLGQAGTLPRSHSSTRTRWPINGTAALEPKRTDGEFPPGQFQGVHLTNHCRMVAQIGVQAARALDYAHAQGTLHRDIKPGNVLIDADGVICIADFGLARVADLTDMTCSGDVVGTLRYMAPEQLRGEADARSDVCGLGLTLYELLTLQPAFRDPQRRRCFHQQQVEPEPEPPRQVQPAIPRDLETIVLKCLAHEPSQRYPTAAALADDLQCYLEDQPIQARRSSLIERGWRWCRRNPPLATMTSVAALLTLAVLALASAGYIQIRNAYAGTKRALTRAEATSHLALDTLDRIYLQLSPERIRIASDADPGGDVCNCLGLRSGSPSTSLATRVATRVQPSEETASLLRDLLVVYDRLAEQVSDDSQVLLQSGIASRRVGDIRHRLGQFEQAAKEYTRAIEKIGSLSTRPDLGIEPRIELARCYNELGNVRSAQLDSQKARESHQLALSVLPEMELGGRWVDECRYELARTWYFLSNRGFGEWDNPRQRDPAERTGDSRPHRLQGEACRRQAVSILEILTCQHPAVPEYRFLLALCQRPSGAGTPAAANPRSDQGRQQAIRILEELVTQYPEVDDYRYELAATYAWIRVGLFPWQKSSADLSLAEPSLYKALKAAEWLAAHRPAVSEYARAETLILAKLGTICWRTGRLAEAEDHFRQALHKQQAAVANSRDLPPQQRVLFEFVRLRLAQARLDRQSKEAVNQEAGGSRDLLETCIANLGQLTQTAELAEDRLAWSSLATAYDTLGQVYAAMGENRRAELAKKRGEAIRWR